MNPKREWFEELGIVIIGVAIGLMFGCGGGGGPQGDFVPLADSGVMPSEAPRLGMVAAAPDMGTPVVSLDAGIPPTVMQAPQVSVDASPEVIPPVPLVDSGVPVVMAPGVVPDAGVVYKTPVSKVMTMTGPEYGIQAEIEWLWKAPLPTVVKIRWKAAAFAYAQALGRVQVVREDNTPTMQKETPIYDQTGFGSGPTVVKLDWIEITNDGRDPKTPIMYKLSAWTKTNPGTAAVIVYLWIDGWKL